MKHNKPNRAQRATKYHSHVPVSMCFVHILILSDTGDLPVIVLILGTYSQLNLCSLQTYDLLLDSLDIGLVTHIKNIIFFLYTAHVPLSAGLWHLPLCIGPTCAYVWKYNVQLISLNIN